MVTDSVPVLLAMTNEKGYDDVFVYAPPKCVAEIGNRIMGMDGCMNIIEFYSVSSAFLNWNEYLWKPLLKDKIDWIFWWTTI